MDPVNLQKLALYVAGASLALAAGAVSAIGRRVGYSLARRLSKIEIGGIELELADGDAKPRFAMAKRQVVKRLTEARDTKTRKLSSARVFKFTAGLLVFSQYVIGGVLATSFAQQQVSKGLISLLGALVVAASVFNRHFHPEITARIAGLKADRIHALIRESEDRIVVIEAKMGLEDDPQPMLELLERITARLNAITTEADPAQRPAPRRSRSRQIGVQD